MWGIIKEVGVDDEGLAEFYNKYYTYPLYKDDKLAVYQAFGNRKIKLNTWNPIKLYKGYKEMTKRVAKEKNITGNLKGEGIIQGGVLVLDKQGQIQYVYEEDIGNELEMKDIQAAVDAVVSGKSAASSASTSPASQEL